MKKILLLTSGLGEDTYAPAYHVQDALQEIATIEIETQILDLFDNNYGRFQNMRRLSPASTEKSRNWFQRFYPSTEISQSLEKDFASLQQLHFALRDQLLRWQPDAVITFSPLYNMLLKQLRAENETSEFTLFSVLNDMSPSADGSSSASDYYLVAGARQLEILEKERIPVDKIHVVGLAVSSVYARQSPSITVPNLAQGRPHLLYLMPNSGKKAVKLLEALADRDEWDVTVSVGRDAECAALARKAAKSGTGRMRVIGWTRHLPRLFLSHNLAIGCPDETCFSELIAARCPLIAFPVAEGDGYSFLRQTNAGVVAAKTKHALDWLERAFAEGGRLNNVWRQNLAALGEPDGAQRIAHFVLEHISRPTDLIFPPLSTEVTRPFFVPRRTRKELLLCDFHTHTNWSDGQLSVRELIDFYGQRRFDCLCITDHLCDPKRLLGKLVNLTGLVIPPLEIADYFAEIEREKKRAWDKYDLLLWAGVEFNKDGYTPKTSTHLLGLDLKKPIDPSLHLKEIIEQIHEQSGLAIASHPHKIKSKWGKETLYLWENQDEYAPLLDAWEVANRDDIFNPVTLKKLPFLANSDLHKPKHIYSWKTLLHCEKDSEAIKQCIRVNRDVSLTLYRDDWHLNRHDYEGEPTPPLTILAPLEEMTS